MQLKGALQLITAFKKLIVLFLVPARVLRRFNLYWQSKQVNYLQQTNTEKRVNFGCEHTNNKKNKSPVVWSCFDGPESVAVLVQLTAQYCFEHRRKKRPCGQSKWRSLTETNN